MRFVKLIACIGLIVCFGASGWLMLAYAQDGAPGEGGDSTIAWANGVSPPDVRSLSWGEAFAQSESFVEQAKAADLAQNHNLAAQLYLGVAAQLPESQQKQRMLLMAATQFDRAGKTADALALCDQVIDMERQLTARPYADAGAGRQPRLDKLKAEALRGHAYSALRFQVASYYQAGDAARALQVIRRLRAEFPKYDALKDVLPIQAAIERRDVNDLMVREETASRLADEASAAYTANNLGMVYTLADQILTQYPDTASAFRVRQTKAFALSRDGRHVEERAILGEILSAFGNIAPNAKLARYAAYRAAWWDGAHLMDELMVKTIRKQAVATDWEQLDGYCQTVTDNCPDPVLRLEMSVIRLCGFGWEGQYENVVELRNRLIRSYAKPGKLSDPVIKRLLARAQLHAGAALQKLARYDEALDCYQWILNVEAQPPILEARLSSLPETYFRIWATLRAKGASPEDVGRAAQDVTTQFPDTLYAKAVRRHMSK